MVILSQPAITCSDLTIETLEQSVRNFRVNSKNTRTTSTSFWFFTVNFEHISHLILVFLLLNFKSNCGLKVAKCKLPEKSQYKSKMEFFSSASFKNRFHQSYFSGVFEISGNVFLCIWIKEHIRLRNDSILYSNWCRIINRSSHQPSGL